MALVTKKSLTESILALIEGGTPSAGKKFEARMIQAHLQQAINRKLKTEYLTVTLPGDETIPDGLVVACYNDIPVTRYKGVLSRAVLPAQPISLRKNMGVYFVGPATGGNLPPSGVIDAILTIEAEIGGSISITGTTDIVTGLTPGSTVVTCNAFYGIEVNVIRGNIPIAGPNIVPTDGSNYFTKVTNSNIITFSSPLVAGEYVKIQGLDVVQGTPSFTGTGWENAATFASISDSTQTRWIYVAQDETNNGDKSLYIYNGTLKFVETVN